MKLIDMFLLYGGLSALVELLLYGTALAAVIAVVVGVVLYRRMR
jgi:uncharacterized membrane protein YjjP (DUF1212 family)